MTKPIATLLLCAVAAIATAQKPPASTEIQPFGKIEVADLQMSKCDFEPDANAEVLFVKGNLYYDQQFNIILEYHKRIKIFNDHGKNNADVRIEYYGGNHLEDITGVQAETINLTDGKIEITKLDKKLIYTKYLDKVRTEISFTLPNIKPGSVVEYKYSMRTSYGNFPDWDFQEKLPVRYNEFDTAIPDPFYYRVQPNIDQPYAKNTRTTVSRSLAMGGDAISFDVEQNQRAMANVRSLTDEPYMSSYADNVQRLIYQLVSVKPFGGFVHNHSDTWARVGGILSDDDDFGGQLKRKLNNEEVLINKAKALKTDDEKIAYLFNEVKNNMKWNGSDRWYTIDGTYRAWENKTGNSAEINIILYHLLKQSGIKAYPMVVSTKEHGKVIPFYTSLAQFNRAVVYIPVDSAKNYVLDATSKYNIYSETPASLLNSSGLYIDKSKDLYDIVFLHRDQTVRQTVLIDAEIKAGGKLEGTAQISSPSYHRISAVEKYKTDGEKKYIEYLTDGDNNLKISSIKFDNMEVDTLPLTQKVNFNMDLSGSDENYIYLNPNLFTSLKSNPFLSENRMTDIDFIYLRGYTVNGIYKIPAGYKTDALPKSISMTMPDRSVYFKRMIVEQEGTIVVRYNIEYKKTVYSKTDYPDFHEFIKKMHEMLNEQIVFKKS